MVQVIESAGSSADSVGHILTLSAALQLTPTDIGLELSQSPKHNLSM